MSCVESTLIILLAIYNPPEISILFSKRIHKQDKFECKTFEYRRERKAHMGVEGTNRATMEKFRCFQECVKKSDGKHVFFLARIQKGVEGK